nr:hypothetical protein [Tanacetum cinerariifolium]
MYIREENPSIKKTDEGVEDVNGGGSEEDTSQPPPPIASPEAPQMVSSEVIMNGNSAVQMTKDEAGNKIKVPHVTAQQILARTSKRKAKSTLLMAILDEHLARFHETKDAKTLWAAIQTRFGDNIDIDDMYNNLKVYEADIKGSSGSSSNSQNVAFVSVESTSSTNEVNTAYSVSTTICHSSQAQGSSLYADELMLSFFANQSSSLHLDNEDLEQIDQDDLKEMDLKWQVAMLSLRVKRFYKKTKRKLEFNGKEPVGFDKTKVKCFNCHRRKHFARDCRSARNSGNRSKDAGNAGYIGRYNGKRPVKEEDEKALVFQDRLGTYDWSYQVEEEATNFALMAFTLNPSRSSSSNSDLQSCSKQCEQSYEQLKTLFDEQREKLSKANIEIIGYQYSLESIEGQLRVHQQNEVIYEEKIGVLEYQVKDKINLLKYTQKQAKVKTGLGYDSQFNEKEVLHVKEEEVIETVFDNHLSDEENNLANDRFKKGEGYYAVPPPLTGNYMPPKSNLSFDGLDDSIYTFQISETVTSVTKDEKDAPKTKLIPAKIDFVKAGESVKHVKPVESVKHVTPVKPIKTAKQTKKSKTFSSSPKVDRKDWNGKMTQKLRLGFGFTKKACFMCGSMSHLIKDCTFHEDRMAKKFVLPTNVGKGTSHGESRPVWNNVQRINHYTKFAPTTVFTRSGRIPVSAAKPKPAASTCATKPVNTAGPK